jgi:hypothetical protein
MRILLHVIAWVLFASLPIEWVLLNVKQWSWIRRKPPAGIAVWVAMNAAELWAFFYLWRLR